METVEIYNGAAALVVRRAGPAGAAAPASSAANAADEVAWLRQAAGPARRESSRTLGELAAHFEPISAAGGLVSAPDGRLLLIHRLGHWDLPKGKLEPHETPEAAAAREIAEEVGLRSLTRGAALPDTYHVYEHKGRWLLKTTHWFHYTAEGSLDLTLQTDEQIDDAEWVPREAVLKRQPMYASIRSLLERALAQL